MIGLHAKVLTQERARTGNRMPRPHLLQRLVGRFHVTALARAESNDLLIQLNPDDTPAGSPAAPG